MAESVLKLIVDDKEYNASIKNARQGMVALEQSLQKAGKSFTDVDSKVLEYVRAIGNMNTQSTTAKGKIGEMSTAFTELALQYKRMTDQEKASPAGKALSESLDQLKVRIQQQKQDLADVTKSLGDMDAATKQAQSENVNFGSVLQGLGSQLGINSQLMGVVTTGTMGYAAAITAAATATIAATKAWAEYNAELSKQTQITTVTTGLEGMDAAQMTDSSKSIADVYGVDFREVINAANALMTQFGKNGDDAIQLIRDGMQGMIEGDGGKLLSMIQQYAPAFQSAGVEASQLVAVIQNSEGGIFTDQNMQAIIMALPKIKMMSETTAKALAGIGIDGKKMAADVENGSMTVFEALQKISQAIDDNKEKSKETAAVMQEMFGRQARMSGDNLGKAIATLNTNLEETKIQTGAVGQSLANLEMANERLNKALRETFGYDGWEQMSNGIKTMFVGALAEAVAAANNLRDTIYDLTGIDAFSAIISGAMASLGPVGELLDKLRQIAGLGTIGGSGLSGEKGAGMGGGVASIVGNVKKDDPAVETEEGKALKAEIERLKKALADANKPKKTTTKQTKTAEFLPDGSVAAVEKQLGELQKAQKLVTDTAGWREYESRIESVKNQISLLKGELPKDKVATFRVDAITDEARTAIEGIQGVRIDDKDLKVTADTQEAFDKIRELYPDAPIELDVKVKLETKDFSKLTTSNIGAFLSDLQKQSGTVELGTDAFSNLQNQIADATAFKNVIEQAMQVGVDAANIDASSIWKQISAGVDIDDPVWQELVDLINAKLAEIGEKPIEINFKTGSVQKVGESVKALSASAQATANAVSAIGGAFNSIEDPAAKVAGTIAQAIATVALGYAQAMAAPKDPWTWIAFATTGMATMIASINAIKQNAGSFEEGGIVPGNSFMGDRLTANVNSGELILSRAQQNSIASQLEGKERQEGYSGTPYVDGEKIWLGLGNYLRRSGRGEIITSKNR